MPQIPVLNVFSPRPRDCHRRPPHVSPWNIAAIGERFEYIKLDGSGRDLTKLSTCEVGARSHRIKGLLTGIFNGFDRYLEALTREGVVGV